MPTSLRGISENVATARNSKRLKIKNFLENLPSGTEFGTDTVAKLVNLGPNSASQHIKQYSEIIEYIGKMRWRKK
jgi:hypothetical protein